ncbi:MAG: BglG family transcription antiterminator LicT [Lachnospiraceae bacterium]
MKIKRVLNNNAVISENSDGIEILVLGSGIAFKKKAGDMLDIERIEKTFILKEKDVKNKFTDLLTDIPLEYIMVSEKIINFAKIKLGKGLNEIIYVNLTDHLYSVVQRYKNNIILRNPLKWSIQRFYGKEYEVGEKALQVVKKELGTELEDDEAAFIAMHFVNAQLNGNPGQAYGITEVVVEVTEIVKEFYNTEFDEGAFDYHRFVTHIMFFAQRLLANTQMGAEDDQELFQIIKRKYPDSYRCSEKIKEFIESKYDYLVDETELLYLTVHITRIVKNL